MATIKIPAYLHRSIIGPSGNGIRKMITDFGGPDKIKIKFPPPAQHSRRSGDGDDDEVIVHANRDNIENIVLEIQKIVAAVYVGGNEALMSGFVEEENIVEEEFTISKADVSRILDRGGRPSGELESKWGVKVWVVDAEANDSFCIVRIVGRAGMEKKVVGAKNEIMVSGVFNIF
jgi:hypothetical protein